ncbi:mCG140795, partial [Mus musculus]
SNIQTQSATVSWTQKCNKKCDINSSMTYELALSSNGKNGPYKNIYIVTIIRGAEHRSVSEVVSFTTPGCEPDPPLASRTKNSLSLQWKIFACNLEGRSNPSGEVKYTTRPARPGCPNKPYVVGTIHAHQVTIGWDLPKDNGGMNISSYSLEVYENSDANLWKMIYNGTRQEFLYDDLQPATTYKLRVFCTSPSGQSLPSDILTIQTPTLPPESCRSQPLRGKTKGKDANLPDNHSVNGKLEAHVCDKKAKGPHQDRKAYPSSEKKCASLFSHARKWSMHGKWLKGIVNQACVFQAVDTVGVGMFGGTAKVTTSGTIPARVSVLQKVENRVPAKLSSTCIAILWEEPDCHGSPITGYNIEYEDKKIVTVKRITEYVLKDLQPNTTYRFSVFYRGPDVTYKVQMLSEYTEYKFKIQACNEAGEGPESDIYTFTTTKSPPTALK